jgi:xanthine dehydrogenase small subunit
VRASALTASQRGEPEATRRALLAHLCRCTGWVTIEEAIRRGPSAAPIDVHGTAAISARRRALLEGGVAQDVGALVASGGGGFADDLAPSESLVAVLSAEGEWVVGETLADARRRAGKVQGRKSTVPLTWPVDAPPGDWARTLRTTWVEPGYLEPDAAWCRPGGEPATPLGNGGAFGGKTTSEVGAVARRLADEHQRPVRVLYSREDVVRRGPKRPPMAIAVAADGSGAVRVAHSGDEDPHGAIDAVRAGLGAMALAPDRFHVSSLTVDGPPTSTSIRAAGWAEVAVVAASLADNVDFADVVVAPNGATAAARLDPSGAVHAAVRCGDPLDETVLRSYCIGAAHMALGWVRSEGLAVGADGVPVDLTIRSFGILRAVDTPPIHITIEPDEGEPVNGSDAVFAAVAAAAWRAAGHPPAWPTVH